MRGLLLGFVLVLVGHNVSADNGTWTMIDTNKRESYADVPDGTIIQFEINGSAIGADATHFKLSNEVAASCVADTVFIREINPTRIIVVCELRRRRALFLPR